MKRHGHTFKLKVLCLCLFSFPIFAQDTAKVLRTVPIIEFFPIQYRIAELSDASPKYYISQEVLKALGARDIGDALKFIPGAQVRDYGGVGGVKTVSYRSLGATHTGVSLDRNPVVNNQVGSINLSSFESFGLRSMSFSTGQPQALSAMASAYLPANQLNIQTKLAQYQDHFNLEFYQNLTSINAQETGLMLGSNIGGKFGVAGQVFARYGSGEYDFIHDLSGSNETQRRVNSKMLNYKARVRTTYEMRNGWLGASYYHNKNDQQLPGAVILYNPSNDQTIQNEDHRADVDFLNRIDNWLFRANALMSTSHTFYHDPTFLNADGHISSSYRQYRQGGGLMVNRMFTEHMSRLFFGADYYHSSLESSEFSNNPDRHELISVVGNTLKLGSELEDRWVIEANVALQLIFDQARSADSLNKKTYSRFSPHLGFSVKPFKAQDLRFRSFYKRAFRMPSFNDLYYNFIGNSNLLPEDAHLVDIGTSWQTSNLDKTSKSRSYMLELAIDGYYTHVLNKIVAVPTKDLFNWSMQNIGKTRAVGVDINIAYMHVLTADWKLNLGSSFSYNSTVDITDETSPSYGHQIPYTPQITNTLTTAVSYKGYALEINQLFTGKRYSLNENIPINELVPFVDLSIGCAKQFVFKDKNEIGVNFKVMNILNKNYEVIRSFPMPGRYYQLTLRYELK